MSAYTSVAQNVLDTADIVRDRDVSSTTEERRSYDTVRQTRCNQPLGFQIDQNNKLVGPNAVVSP